MCLSVYCDADVAQHIGQDQRVDRPRASNIVPYQHHRRTLPGEVWASDRVSSALYLHYVLYLRHCVNTSLLYSIISLMLLFGEAAVAHKSFNQENPLSLAKPSEVEEFGA